jgi:hypothetical protein
MMGNVVICRVMGIISILMKSGITRMIIYVILVLKNSSGHIATVVSL